jgi:hypothetical protein
MAGTTGTDADLFCAADRRRGRHSMVIRRRAVSPKAGLHALTQTQSTLAHDLDIRAVAALNEAREIPREMSATRQCTRQWPFEMPLKCTSFSAANATRRPNKAPYAGRTLLCARLQRKTQYASDTQKHASQLPPSARMAAFWARRD